VKRGFTLVEVIITLAIIAGGMTALLMAFSAAIGISANIEEQNTALEIADAVMEGLKNTTYANLQGFTKESGAFFSNLTGYTVAVTTTKPADPARIDVTVSWVGKGGAANVTLTTLATL